MASVPTLGSGNDDTAPWQGLGKKHCARGPDGQLGSPQYPLKILQLPPKISSNTLTSPSIHLTHPSTPQHSPESFQHGPDC